MSFSSSPWIRGSLTALCIIFALAAVTPDAEAAKKKRPATTRKTPQKQPVQKARGYQGGPKAFILMNAQTGEILAESNAEADRQPASIAKVMTALLVFDEFRKGTLKPEQMLALTDGAALRADGNRTLGKPGGRIRTGTPLSVDTLLRSLLVYSACDAAETLAQKIGGSEREFAALMTEKAYKIGMTNTRFTNSSGREDPRQITTAKDMAILYSHLLKTYPQYMDYLALTSFDVGGSMIKGHNKILVDYTCRDQTQAEFQCTSGKTGYFRRAGFNGVFSATWDGYQIVAVSFGSRSPAARNQLIASLFDTGFAKLRQSNAPRTHFAQKPAPAKPTPLDPEHRGIEESVAAAQAAPPEQAALAPLPPGF